MSMVIEKWDKLPRKKKGYAFLGVASATALALILGLVLVDRKTVKTARQTKPPAPALELTDCAFYEATDGNSSFPYRYEGLICASCSDEIGIVLDGCLSTCTTWELDTASVELTPVVSTCDIVTVPTETPTGLGFQCPAGYYRTLPNLGCRIDDFDTFKEFTESCFLFGTGEISNCFEVCEAEPECAAVIVSATGTSCYGIPPGLVDDCSFPSTSSLMCKKVPVALECPENLLNFEDAKAFCEENGQSLVFGDDSFIIGRVVDACVSSEVGCWLDFTEFDEYDACYFTDSSLPFGVSATTNCQELKHFCCEVPTPSPTTSPTTSPTHEVYFVPSVNETNYTEADEDCRNAGAFLASIHSTFEQDFAWDVCQAALDITGNPCGCWIGLDRDPLVVSLNPADFFWDDGSGNAALFNNFESYPEQQPNNNGNRNEACVHMRPFTDGGWNDLPCSGFCDADDTKPLALCKRLTDSPTVSPTTSPTNLPTTSPTKNPTTSPTKNPTTSPTTSPTLSPTNLPTTSPTESPTRSPTKSPTTSPTKNPTKNPTTSPTRSPTKNPTESPTKNPTDSPTKNPTDSPTKNPTTSPTKNPTDSPTKNPTDSPTRSPTDSPTKNPTTSPTKNPTRSPSNAPTTSPTKNPTDSPTTSPTKNPTDSPTKNPTTSPTKNPTDSPTKNPTDSPTKNPTTSPTKNPTTSPTKNPTDSPTKNPTTSPTKNPTTSPTESPTKFPTTSPTKNPTTSPTKSPTLSPTTSPTPSPFGPTIPDPECRNSETGETTWTVENPNTVDIVFQFQFRNPGIEKVGHPIFVPAKPPFYPDCFSTQSFCGGSTVVIEAGDTYLFTTPSRRIFALYPCQTDPLADPCFEVFNADPLLPECKCPHEEFFFEDFESYIAGNAVTPDSLPAFFVKWNVSNNGNVDIKGFEADGVTPTSDFDENPCVRDDGSKNCIDVDGTLESHPVRTELFIADGQIYLPAVDTFFNRICTLNFLMEGNRRCGKNHGFPLKDRRKFHCAAFYPGNAVPLYDNMTVGIRLTDGTILGETEFVDIAWNQSFEPYGVTVDAPDGKANISGYFNTASEKLNEGGNIGPLIDNIDVTCCCPSPDDRYVSQVYDYEQGLTAIETAVSEFKSDPAVILGQPPKFPAYPQIYTLGLGGYVTYKFDLGVSEYVYIYEESFETCCVYNFEDATVEVSVDGVNWLLVAESFSNLWQVWPPALDNSIKFAKIDLPNGACFKYIRITDTSIAECDASDGFDLVAIVVGEPCCPHVVEGYDYEYDGETPVTQDFDIKTIVEVPAIAGIMFAFATIGAVALAGMTALYVNKERHVRKVSRMSILEPEGFDITEFEKEKALKKKKRDSALEESLPVIPKAEVAKEGAKMSF